MQKLDAVRAVLDKGYYLSQQGERFLVLPPAGSSLDWVWSLSKEEVDLLNRNREAAPLRFEPAEIRGEPPSKTVLDDRR